MVRKKMRRAKVLAVAGVVGFLLFLFFMLGPPKLLAKSDEPNFCVQCHVMESQFEAWAHTGAHRRKKCVDCHLPNENTAIHYAWKSLDGLKDAAIFFSGTVPERIQLTAHGAKVLQENCIRCHVSTVEMISHERRCWDCHRRIMHKRSGTIETS